MRVLRARILGECVLETSWSICSFSGYLLVRVMCPNARELLYA